MKSFNVYQQIESIGSKMFNLLNFLLDCWCGCCCWCCGSFVALSLLPLLLLPLLLTSRSLAIAIETGVDGYGLTIIIVGRFPLGRLVELLNFWSCWFSADTERPLGVSKENDDGSWWMLNAGLFGSISSTIDFWSFYLWTGRGKDGFMFHNHQGNGFLSVQYFALKLDEEERRAVSCEWTMSWNRTEMKRERERSIIDMLPIRSSDKLHDCDELIPPSTLAFIRSSWDIKKMWKQQTLTCFTSLWRRLTVGAHFFQFPCRTGRRIDFVRVVEECIINLEGEKKEEIWLFLFDLLLSWIIKIRNFIIWYFCMTSHMLQVFPYKVNTFIELYLIFARLTFKWNGWFESMTPEYFSWQITTTSLCRHARRLNDSLQHRNNLKLFLHHILSSQIVQWTILGNFMDNQCRPYEH